MFGLDTSKSIINYIYDNIEDEFKEYFKLPNYVNELLNNNYKGIKTGCGLYKKEEDKEYVYDIKNNDYRLKNKYEFYFVNEMKKNIKIGDYKEAFEILINDESKEAKLCKEMILEYIVYSLYVADMVADNIYACDDAMATGFCWLPPISYIGLIGGKERFYDLVEKNLNKEWIKVLNNNKLLEKVNDISRYDYRKFIKLDC